MANWSNLSGVSLNELEHNRKSLHQAVQIVSAFPRNYLPHDPTDGMASLEWSDNHSGLESLPYTIGEEGSLRVGLSMEQFKLYISIDGKIKASVSLSGMTILSGFDWLRHELDNIGVPPHKLNLDLPYEIEDYNYSQSLKVNEDALKEYSSLFQNTDKVLNSVLEKWKDSYDIRCWPHHFDLATLIPLETDSKGEILKSIGVGFSPGDEGIAEPYVYVNIWPQVSLETLEKHKLTKGYWNKEGWSGAVLTYTDLLKSNNQKEDYQAFVHHAISVLQGEANH